MDFTNGNKLLEICKSENIKISEAMIRREAELFSLDKQEIADKMKSRFYVMRESVEEAKNGERDMLGGYIGGESRAMLSGIAERGALGGVISLASAYAMGVIEVNASMGRIVAAPTAGSSGVLSGILVALSEKYGFTDDELTLALFNAGAVGYLISRNATVAGAEGGCQAEVGAASAMAASAVCELFGGTPEQCLCAAADAISNILGLVCDPIGGLVETPCQKRNAMGVANAVICAEIALSSSGAPIVPFDEVVAVMKNVGESMPAQLRETSLGGLAASPSAKKAVPRCKNCNGCK